MNALASEIGPASAPIERARAAHYLHPGGLVATREATRVTTILGSCVSVCLWDQRLGYGGVNHYLLPHWARSSTQSPHCYGNLALNGLLEALLALGCRRERLLARVYGGACVLDAFRGRREHLGQMNVTVARRFLDGLGIPVIDEHVGGARGRKLAFSTDDGSAELRLL